MYPYSQTYADVGAAPSDVCWRLLRALRADPPEHARGDRHATFASALEQSEQLFAAAKTVGPATRPILLFYGLSQAGRAIVAALAAQEDNWKLKGHGIKLAGAIRPGSVANAKVTPDERPSKPGREDDGSFVRVVEVLNSSSLSGPTRLGDLWPLIRPAYKFPLPNSGPLQLIPASVKSRQRVTSSEYAEVQLSSLPADLHVGDQVSSSGVRGDWEEQTQKVRSLLANYPSLNSWVSPVPKGQPIGVKLDASGVSRVSVYFDSEFYSQFATDEEFERHIVYRDAGHTCVYPVLDGSDRPIHPIAVWWSVLFGLSMLARYEPEQWAEAIDVNRSPEAVPIEHLLQAALDHLPELIHRALVGLP